MKQAIVSTVYTHLRVYRIFWFLGTNPLPRGTLRQFVYCYPLFVLIPCSERCSQSNPFKGTKFVPTRFSKEQIERNMRTLTATRLCSACSYVPKKSVINIKYKKQSVSSSLYTHLRVYRDFQFLRTAFWGVEGWILCFAGLPSKTFFKNGGSILPFS